MERRGFIKGLISAVTSTGLVVSATPRELESFGAPAVRESPVVVAVPELVRAAEVGEELYNARGELVALVTQVTVHVGRLDVSHVGAAYRTFSPGLPEVEIRAVGVGPVDFSRDARGHGVVALRGERRRG